jgi:hypothetical protein
MKILLLALMVGCASGPNLSELEDQYFECTRDGAVGCDEIAAEIDRRYELKKMRADRRLPAWKERQQRILADECKRAFAGRIKIFLMVVCPREARPHLKPASQMVGPLSKRFYGVEAVETETPHSEMQENATPLHTGQSVSGSWQQKREK